MDFATSRRQARVSAGIALALACLAGTAAAQQVPATFTPRPLLSKDNTISNLIGTTMTF